MCSSFGASVCFKLSVSKGRAVTGSASVEGCDELMGSQSCIRSAITDSSCTGAATGGGDGCFINFGSEQLSPELSSGSLLGLGWGSNSDNFETSVLHSTLSQDCSKLFQRKSSGILEFHSNIFQEVWQYLDMSIVTLWLGYSI